MLGRGDPEAERHGRLGARLRAPHHLGKLIGERRALAGGADDGHRIQEAARPRTDLCEALGRCGGRDERHERHPMRVARREHLRRLLKRQVGHDQPARAAPGEALHERVHTRGQHHVGVAHHHHRNARRERPRHLQHARQARAGRERSGASLVDHGAVCQRVGVGHPQLEHVRPRLHARLPDLHRLRQRRKAAHQVGHQRGALAVSRERLRDPLDPRRLPPACARWGVMGGRGSAHRASTSARSLSPRPDRQTRSSSPSDWASVQASAWAVSSAGMMPSRRDSTLNAASASRSVTAT